MSLQVWLPLNGSLENQGLKKYNLSMFRGTEVYNNNGKIGKCFYANGANTIKILNIIPDFYNYTSYSLCAWFYIEAQNTAHSGSAIISGGNWNYQVLNLAVSDWSSDHYTRLRVSNTNWTKTYSYNFSLNTWYHVVVSSDGNKTYAYVNGQLIGNTIAGFLPTSISGDDICIGGATYNGNMQFFGRINDVRIYDHCLSDKEVEELSKGLVLHYKLNDNFQQKNINIMPNYLNMALGSANSSTGTWRLAGTSNMERSRVLISDSPEGECYGFQNDGIQTANDGSCYGIDNFPLDGNSIYTISMWARIINGTEGYAGYNIYASTDKGGSYTKIDKNYRVTPLPASGEWVKCWYTFSTNANNTRNIYIGITTGSTSVTTQMCCVHIEKIDNSVDRIIYDSSGYQNNGIINGNLNINNNTSKYNNSIYFDGNTAAIQTPDLTTMIKDKNYTISCWTYKTQIGEKNYQTIYGGPSGFELEARSSSSTSPLFKIHNWGGGTTAYEFNKWYHFCFIHTDTNSKLYINGELKLTGTSATVPSGNYFIGAWKTATQQNYDGNISDFRIYATALTEEQVLELYNTSVTIDNKGNIYSREYIEDNNNLNITKTGLFQSSIIHDDDDLTIASILKTEKQIQGNTLYEY